MRFHRAEVVPDDTSLQVDVQISVVEEDFPDSLQIGLKVETQAEQPVDICLELIGLFELVEEYDKPDKEILPDFINERALFMLWPHLTQTIRQITALMAIAPIEIKTPYNYSFDISVDTD